MSAPRVRGVFAPCNWEAATRQARSPPRAGSSIRAPRRSERPTSERPGRRLARRDPDGAVVSGRRPVGGVLLPPRPSAGSPPTLRLPLFDCQSLGVRRLEAHPQLQTRGLVAGARRLAEVLTERPDRARCAGYRGLQVPRSPIPLRSHGVLARSRSGTTSPLLDPPSVLRSSTRRLVDI